MATRAWRGAGRAVIGLLVGLLNGLLGAGATLLVPALDHLMGAPRAAAHGTALPLILLASSVSLSVYASHGRLPVAVGLLVALGGTLGGLVGAWLMRYLSAVRLRRLFGLALVVAAVRMLWG